MPNFDAILAVFIAGFVLSATPGPSMLYVLSRTVGQSRAAGLASALGLAVGGILLAIATAIGLAALFAKFDWLVVVLRYLGSAYLVFLGVKMILNARKEARLKLHAENVNVRSFMSIILQGIFVELLNPKTVLFFALFLPPFVTGVETASPENIRNQLLVLGILVPLAAVPSDLFVAFMGGTLTKLVNGKQAFRERLAWAGGIALIIIAINLHFGYF